MWCKRYGLQLFEFSSAPKQRSNELDMLSLEGMFKKQEENLFNRKNDVKYGQGSYKFVQNLAKGDLNLKVWLI